MLNGKLTLRGIYLLLRIMNSKSKQHVFYSFIFLAVFLFYFHPIVLNVPGSRTLGYWGDKMGLIYRLEAGEAGFLNQPLMRTAISFLSNFLSPFGVYNFLVLLSFPLSCLFSYRLFRRFFDSWLSFALSLVFTFSPYHIYKAYNHIDLAQVWVFPFFFSALLDFDKQKSTVNTLKLGVVMAGTTLFSNYYGYFMLLILAIYFIIDVILRIKSYGSISKDLATDFRGLIADSRRSDGKLPRLLVDSYRLIKPYSLLTTFFLLFTVPFLLPYIDGIYFGRDTAVAEIASSVEGTGSRGITDFVAFSARPWYYIAPSIDHPIFGGVAQSIHGWFESTGYFLFDDFFYEEHSAVYLGIVNLILAGYALYRLFRTKQTAEISNFNPPAGGLISNEEDTGEMTSSSTSLSEEVATFTSRSEERALKGANIKEAGQWPAATKNVAAKHASPSAFGPTSDLRLQTSENTSYHPPAGGTSYYIGLFFFLSVGLFILSLPPFVSLGFAKIYLPSYVLMKVFPMFRTMSRLGLPMLLCLLVLTGYGLQIFYNSILASFSSGRSLTSDGATAKRGASAKHGSSRYERARTKVRYCQGEWFYCLLIAVYCLLTLFEFYFPPVIKEIPPRGSEEYQELLEEHRKNRD